MTSAFAGVEEALKRLQQGQMVILTDDESRENEGDLMVSAEFATPEAIQFMALYGRGLICLPMSGEYIDRLGIPMMVSDNRTPYKTAFTVSIEAASGVSTGISAADRARTIEVVIKDDAKPTDIIFPGHVFPLKARSGGVFERNGHTEGSVDLMRLAGLKPASVICEIINDDGTMSRRDELLAFSKRHDIPMISIRDIVDYRILKETLVQSVATTRMPVQEHGDFTMTCFVNQMDDAEHFTLVKGPIDVNASPLVRIHSECITGDVFGSQKCDCGAQLNASMKLIAEEGGVLVYLRQEGRGIGLSNKLKAYALQEKGLDTVEANLHLGFPIDKRDYAVAFQLLREHGIKQLKLLTNNPQKIETLERYGMQVTERVALNLPPTSDNANYLKTKRDKLGHYLEL